MHSKSQIRSIGIDLGKTTFHLVALGTRAQIVMRKKVLPFPATGVHGQSVFIVIGMEAEVG